MRVESNKIRKNVTFIAYRNELNRNREDFDEYLIKKKESRRFNIKNYK